MITGLGYSTLYYNENYEAIIKEIVEKRNNRSQRLKNLIKNFWMKI